jgi:hypothetical protein
MINFALGVLVGAILGAFLCLVWAYRAMRP